MPFFAEATDAFRFGSAGRVIGEADSEPSLMEGTHQRGFTTLGRNETDRARQREVELKRLRDPADVEPNAICVPARGPDQNHVMSKGAAVIRPGRDVHRAHSPVVDGFGT
jgi:hypothetical protein